MKKLLIISLLVLPISVNAASSVRMLGSNSNAKSATIQKITPTKTNTTVSDGSITSSRVGTLRANQKTVGAISGSNSRFPIITTVRPYNSVATPTGSGTTTTVVPASVDTDAIVNAVTQRIENNYYNKEQVYNNNNFIEAVKDVDDPRIDAIKVGSKPVHSANLPSDYVYIWIEQ